MKQIPLGKSGLFAQVDDEDFDFLNQFRWAKSTKTRQGYYPSLSWHTKLCGNLLMHRIIMCVQDKGLVVDHIDGNPLNNCKSNLRVCTRSMNQHNRNVHHDKRYKGVVNGNGVSYSRCKTKKYNYKYFETRIVKNCKLIYKKRHKTEVAAAIDYNTQALKFFGEYAKLNIIKED